MSAALHVNMNETTGMKMEGKEKKFDRKTLKTRRETAVQGTNDSSIVSKCSMAETGYFEDDYLKHFCSKVTRRAPLIHRGYFIRAKTINTLLVEFLDKHQDHVKQIISLGAGFDSAFFRLKAANMLSKTKFIEVDFPDVVSRKFKLIQANNILRDLISTSCPTFTQSQHPLIMINSDEYVLLGADLSQLNTLEALLNHCKVDTEIPTLLLSECVLTYMTKRCSTAVIKWAAESFPNATFVLYEQIIPDDAFGLFMQKHFRIIGSPLKCINSFPTLSAQIERCLKQGWERAEGMNMNDFYNLLLTEEEKNRVENLEPFDEYEEWNLKCSHYAVICSYSGSCPNLLPRKTEMAVHPYSAMKEIKVDLSFQENECQAIQRVGHSCATIGSYIMVTSGFGDENGKHQRLGDILLLSKDLKKRTRVLPGADLKRVELNRMHHSLCTLSPRSAVMIGGRTSPLKLCKQLLRIELQENLSSAGALVNEMINQREELFSNSLTTENSEKHEMGCDMQNCAGNIETLNKCIEEAATDMYLDNFHIDTDIGKVKIEVLKQTGQVPKPRWRHCAECFEKDGKQYLFMFGGRTLNEFALDELFIYDMASRSWVEVKADGSSWPEARQAHSMALSRIHNTIFISGGLNTNLKPLNSIYAYSISDNAWEKLNITGPLIERFSHTSHLIEDFLVLIGGVNTNSTPPGVAIIHIPTRQSMEFPLPEQQEEKLVMLHRHTSKHIGDGRIIIIGGGGNCFSFGTHLNVTPFVIDISHCLKFMKENLK